MTAIDPMTPEEAASWAANEEMFHAEFNARVFQTEWVLVTGGARIQDKELAGRFLEAEQMVDVASYDGHVVVPR
jgi:hypothetical protein